MTAGAFIIETGDEWNAKFKKHFIADGFHAGSHSVVPFPERAKRFPSQADAQALADRCNPTYGWRVVPAQVSTPSPTTATPKKETL